MIIRNLEYYDMPWAIDVACKRMLYEEVERPELYNSENMYLLAHKVVEDRTGFITTTTEGEETGILLGVLVPNIFNPEYTTLAELVWYILPEFRGGRSGALLLKAFQERADEVADEATMSLLPTSNINLTSLSKRGWVHSENAFRRGK